MVEASVAGKRTTALLSVLIFCVLAAVELPVRLAGTPVSASVIPSHWFFTDAVMALTCVVLNDCLWSALRAFSCVAFSAAV